MTTRAAIYARVSSAAQRDAQTIEGQLRELRAFVAARGWSLVATFTDDGRSATTGKLEKRDGFARCVAAAGRREYDVLVIFALDRLTRTDSIDERAAVYGPFQRAGVRIVTPTNEIDLGTMFGQLDATLRALYAAEETKVRIARSIAGRERGLALGRKPQGVTPYGLTYSRFDHTWSIDPERASIAREILARILGGESCKEIAEDLRERGAPAMRSGWHRRAVWRIATAEHLTGRWLAHKATRTTIDVPAITDRETFARVQEALSWMKTRGLRKTKHVYLLEGIAVCGQCGQPMGIRSARPNAGYMRAAAYVCRSRLAAEYRTLDRCTSPCLPVIETDEEVWSKVSHALVSDELVAEVRRKQEAREANRRDWAGDVARYESRLAKAAEASAAIAARFRRGLIDERAFDLELAAAAKERRTLEAQLERARDGARTDRPAVNVKALLAECRALAATERPDERRRVVEYLVPKGEAITRGRSVELLVEVEPASRVTHVTAACSNQEHESDADKPVQLRLVAKVSGGRR